MENYNPWDAEDIPIKEFMKRRHAKRSLLEERTLAILEHCKGLSVEDVKTITDRVNARVRAGALYSARKDN